MKKQTKNTNAMKKKVVKSSNAQVENKIIFAEKAYKLWKVYILDLGNNTREAEFYFHSPLKAIRYSFVLKQAKGLAISENALNFLSREHKATKA